jgi:hypothetical protein
VVATELAQSPDGGASLVQDRLDEIGEPLGGVPYASIAQAEQVAGYDIPQPSSNFALLDGTTYLETFWRPISETAPVSRSVYIAPGGDEFTLELIPSTYDRTDSRSKGIPTVIGTKSGWMYEADTYFFGWKCSLTAAGADIYCTVLGDSDNTREEFDSFVESVN